MKYSQFEKTSNNDSTKLKALFLTPFSYSLKFVTIQLVHTKISNVIPQKILLIVCQKIVPFLYYQLIKKIYVYSTKNSTPAITILPSAIRGPQWQTRPKIPKHIFILYSFQKKLPECQLVL